MRKKVIIEFLPIQQPEQFMYKTKPLANTYCCLMSKNILLYHFVYMIIIVKLKT